MVESALPVRVVSTPIGNNAKRLEYDASGNVIYYGKAAPGTPASTPLWAIMKLAYDASGNLVSVLWPGGSSGNDYVWDDRASYAYS